MQKRYAVLVFLVALAIVTFIDRISISVAAPRIQDELHITPDRWGWILGAFVLAYGIFEIPTGAMGDRTGQRAILTRIVVWWSVFTSLTGVATSYSVLLVTRFLFGAGEAGAYPNISGVLARWFPATERARTQGVIWSASRLGGALAPLLVVPLQRSIGWRPGFAVLGGLGIVWALCWRLWYHDNPAEQPGISSVELRRIQAGAAPPSHVQVPWRELLSQRQLWLIFIMYWCYSWGSWFYFNWFPVYLMKGAGFTEREMGFFSATPFLAGAIGNLVGGFLGDRLVARYGLKVGRRAIGTMSLTASALLVFAMTFVKSHLAIVILSSLGFGIADLMLPTAWAVCLDIGGRHAGVVTGFMNTAGQLGGFVCSVLFGYLVVATNNYQQPLWVVSGMVLVAAMLFTRINPERELVRERVSLGVTEQPAS